MSCRGDARTENIRAEYKSGLAEIEKLRPVIYTHKGNDVPMPVLFREADAFASVGRTQDVDALHEASKSIREKCLKQHGEINYEDWIEIQRAQCCAPHRHSRPPYWDSDNFLFAFLQKPWVGLIAQECEMIMPELVDRIEATIDRKRVSDLRHVDYTPIIYALVNAVKELSARVKELEAKK